MSQGIGTALAQMVACRLVGAKPVCEPVLWNFNRNQNIFIQENAFENVVCEM